MKLLRSRSVIIFLFVFSLVTWFVLTLWAEVQGPAKHWTFGPKMSRPQVLIVYDPDPFYNLDEQVCRAFGEAMADSGVSGMVATVAAAKELHGEHFNVYVFCANTYNWRPDWSVTHFIQQDVMIKARPVIALTLGAGSTQWSQAAFEKVITARGGMLIESKSLWLLRPNDETRMEEDNAEVARSVVYDWALELIDELHPYVKQDSL